MTFEPFFLRPGEPRDLVGLSRLVAAVAGGLTTLPPEEGFLEGRLQISHASFRSKVRAPGGEQYFFVLEDARTGEIAGTSAVVSRVGGFDPFYSYAVRRERVSHPPLGIEKEMAVLHLHTNHKGPSEICSLFLRPDLRASGLGRLLSLGRFLFVAEFRSRFDERMIAEMRGFLDADNRSPFWEAVGRVFFERDFHAADFLSGLGEKDFIRDLMPRHPIYVDLLPKAVREVIGRVHRDAEPALRLLRAEGFDDTGEVDIFDAGPLISAARDDIRTVRERRRAPLRAVHPRPPADAAPCLVANTSLADFRAARASLRENADGSADLDAGTAGRLRVGPGDVVQWLRERSTERKDEREKIAAKLG